MPKTRRHYKGEGSIRERKDGRFEVRVVVGYDETGKRKVKSKYAYTRPEAIDLKAKMLLETGKGQVIRSSLTLLQWLEQYIKNQTGQKRETTLSKYQTFKNALKPLHDTLLPQLNVETIETFYKSKTSLWQKSTLEHCHFFLRGALAEAERYDYIERNPCDKVRLPKLPSRSVAKRMSEAHIQSILNHAQGHRIYPMIYLGLSLGLRRGEILGLKWSQVDFERSELHIREVITNNKGKTILTQPKTAASSRTLPLQNELKKVLLEQRQKVLELPFVTEWVFPNTNGEPIAPRRFQKEYAQVLLDAGLPNLYRIHDMRHTFTSRAVSSTNNAKAVSLILGHSKVQLTLDQYTHLEQQELKQVALGIPELRGSGEGK